MNVKEKGFTIVEVLLALALIALIAGLFAANFDVLLSSIQEKRPEKQLYNAIREARKFAIQTHQPTYLSYNNEDGFIVYKDKIKKETLHQIQSEQDFELAFEPVPSEELARGGFRSSKKHSEKESEITFYPDGSSTPTVISLIEDGQSTKIKLDPFSCSLTLLEN